MGCQAKRNTGKSALVQNLKQKDGSSPRSNVLHSRSFDGFTDIAGIDNLTSYAYLLYFLLHKFFLILSNLGVFGFGFWHDMKKISVVFSFHLYSLEVVEVDDILIDLNQF